MTRRDGPIARAARVAANDARRVLEEIATAQRVAGLSHADIGRACRMSRWMVARIIAGSRRASVVELASIGGAVGLDVRLQAYVSGDPIRDAGQQRVLERFRAILHPTIRVRTEVGLPIDGDRRAWDAVISGNGWHAGVEVETVVRDLQAIERRFGLKARDGAVELVVLVVAATTRNRKALAAAPGAFAGLSRDSRVTLAALRTGEPPPASAILLL